MVVHPPPESHHIPVALVSGGSCSAYGGYSPSHPVFSPCLESRFPPPGKSIQFGMDILAGAGNSPRSSNLAKIPFQHLRQHRLFPPRPILHRYWHILSPRKTGRFSHSLPAESPETLPGRYYRPKKSLLCSPAPSPAKSTAFAESTKSAKSVTPPPATTAAETTTGTATATTEA